MTSASNHCSCGGHHPAGLTCTSDPTGTQGTVIPAMTGQSGECEPELSGEEDPDDCRCVSDRAHLRHIPHEHHAVQDCSGHDDPEASAYAPCGCRHEHAMPLPLAPVTHGEVSPTRAIYRIMNMDCPMEETLIRNRLGSMTGISGLEFNLMQRLLTVNHSLPSTGPIEAALRSIDMIPEAVGASPSIVPEPEIPWRRLALAGLLAACAEVAELAHEWGAGPFGLNMGASPFTWLPALLAVAAILLGGLVTYRKGWIALKNRNLNINGLMSVAVTGAFLIGQFPEAAMVMVLFNLAEAIEARALERARNAISELLALAPEKATMRLPDGTWEERDIDGVNIGSMIRVRPGERVALDGVITSGQSSVNQAPITGESLPVEKTVGDTVYAGTINEAGSFEFETTATAGNSTLARIIHAVEEAQGSRAPMQRFVDQFAQYYTPAVFGMAMLAGVIPPLFMDAGWAGSIYNALVILVIACPCALVISTPVSIVSGMAGATRQGILVKGGMFLEQGRKLRWLALDKTGTLTHGRPRQTNVEACGSLDIEKATAIAASIAARSDHPVSRAIADKSHADGTALLDADAITAIPGQGVSGIIDGTRWHIGNHRMIEELGRCSPELEKRIFTLERQGKSVVALVGETGVEALFAVADTIRESSAEAIRQLKQLGVKTMMLTGDNEHTARAIAQQAGVDAFRSNLLPADKLAAIEILEKSGMTGMVGDGINDAPALARADIGFAMAAAGTDTAIETADVALMDDDLRKIPRFIRLSRATYAILVQNIALALGVKIVFLSLAMTGQATMWMAVFADVGTSLLVVANGLRAVKK